MVSLENIMKQNGVSQIGHSADAQGFVMWKECFASKWAQSDEPPQGGADLMAPLFLTLFVSRFWGRGQHHS